MPNNMTRAGISYGSGGSAPKKTKKYADGGMFDTGTPQQDNMNMMAAGGGLMGFKPGGSVLDNLMTFGGSKKSKKK